MVSISEDILRQELYFGALAFQRLTETPLLFWKVRNSISRKSSKMFAPDPTDLIVWIILVFGKPKLALFPNDVKYLVKMSQ